MPAVNLRHIEIFHAVMTAGNLTEAARLLHTSQPTVSRELARFEKVIGLTLFERSRGRLHPTVQGLRLFEEVQRSWYGLDRIVSAAESLREFRQGELSIVCLPVFSQSFLPLLLQPFLARYPEVSLNVVPQESPLLEEWLSAQRHDLGLTENPEHPRRDRTHAAANSQRGMRPARRTPHWRGTRCLPPRIFRAKTTLACRARTAIASCWMPCSASTR
ncbi:LysR family transcriptional regulator [Pseudescherichia vulneris]|nr:LysR family transcriptional regulator [Pseudescherichia vulneris]